MELPQHFGLAVGVLATVALLVVLSMRYARGRPNAAVIKGAASVVKQSADLALTAQELQNPLLSLTRANYARAYLDVARALAPDADLVACSHISLDELEEDIEREEKVARMRLLELCPQVSSGSRVGRKAGYGRRVPSKLAALQEQMQQPAPRASAAPTMELPATQFTRL